MFPHAEDQLDDLVEQEADAPVVTVSWRYASCTENIELVEEERVVWGARGASRLHVQREPAAIAFDLSDRPPPGALVHPLLALPASILARWRGDVTLHAGAFEADGGAWAILGTREAGKSTTLATLATAGCPVVADDLITILDGEVSAGPSCVDLRPDVAEHFPAARYLGEVGRRPRYRLSTPKASPRLPLRGFLRLGWREEPGLAIESMGTSERLSSLYAHEYIGLLGAADPRKILELLAVPGWHLERSRDWATTDSVVEAILALVARGTA